jgi:hypothetical protein
MEKNTFEISGQDSDLIVTFPYDIKLKLRSNETLYFAFKQARVSVVRMLQVKTNGNGHGNVKAAHQRHLIGEDKGWLLLTNQRLLFYGAFTRCQISWQQIGKWRSFKDGFSVQLVKVPYLYRFSGIERYKVSYELDAGMNAIMPMNGSVLREVLDILHNPAAPAQSH